MKARRQVDEIDEVIFSCQGQMREKNVVQRDYMTRNVGSARSTHIAVIKDRRDSIGLRPGPSVGKADIALIRGVADFEAQPIAIILDGFGLRVVGKINKKTQRPRFPRSRQIELGIRIDDVEAAEKAANAFRGGERAGAGTGWTIGRTTNDCAVEKAYAVSERQKAIRVSLPRNDVRSLEPIIADGKRQSGCVGWGDLHLRLSPKHPGIDRIEKLRSVAVADLLYRPLEAGYFKEAHKAGGTVPQRKSLADPFRAQIRIKDQFRVAGDKQGNWKFPAGH